jgi:hypothetical protein
MVIGSGNVVDGRVELDSELPEGASVTALAREGDETFEARSRAPIRGARAPRAARGAGHRASRRTARRGRP